MFTYEIISDTNTSIPRAYIVKILSNGATLETFVFPVLNPSYYPKYKNQAEGFAKRRVFQLRKAEVLK